MNGQSVAFWRLRNRTCLDHLLDTYTVDKLAEGESMDILSSIIYIGVTSRLVRCPIIPQAMDLDPTGGDADGSHPSARAGSRSPQEGKEPCCPPRL